MRYQFKDLYVPSYDTSGAGASEPLPREDLTIAYTPIEVSYSLTEFEFTTGETGVDARPGFQTIEIKPPPKPPSQSLPAYDDLGELTFIERDDPDLVGSLLLPAVQAAEFIPEEEANEMFLDDFVFV